MAKQVLDGSDSAGLPRRPLTATLVSQGTPARLVAHTVSQTPVRVIQQHATMLVLPRIDEATTVTAVPEAGEQFAPGTNLHLTIGLDQAADGVAGVVELKPRDVSALSSVDLATITPQDDTTLVITTRLTPTDVRLPELAAQARVQARAFLQTDRLEGDRAIGVRCLVDGSASMAQRMADGSVAACAEIITGIAAVVSDGRPVEAAVIGDRIEPTQTVEAAELTEFLSRRPPNGFGVAADLSEMVAAAPVGRRSLTVVITDGPSGLTWRPDLPAPVVALTISESRQSVLRPGYAGSVLPPVPGHDPRAYLLGRIDLLGELVGGLLTPLRSEMGR